jgi:simple sugar transport system permease protein
MDVGLVVAELASFGMQQTVAVALAAQGEVITEKSGILNIGIQGSIIMAAFAAALTNVYFEPSLGAYSPLMGVLAGMAAGAAVNLVFAFLSTKLNVDQVIAGFGLQLFAIGVTMTLLGMHVEGSFYDGTPLANTIPSIFVLQTPLLAVPIRYMYVVAFALPALVYLLLYRTKFGLHIRAAGENPRAAEVGGVNVGLTRMMATSLGGVFIGLAGAYLTVDLNGSYTTTFVAGITASVGFIAIAAVVAGAWRPAYVFCVALIFGFSLALISVFGQTSGWTYYVLTMIPYIITVATLAIASKRLRPPAALGSPYTKE